MSVSKRWVVFVAALCSGIAGCQRDSTTAPGAHAQGDGTQLRYGLVRPGGGVNPEDPGGIIRVCVNAASPSATYTIVTTAINAAASDVITSPALVSTQSGANCADVLFRVNRLDPTETTVTVTISSPVAGTFSFVCVDDGEAGAPLCNAAAGAGNVATVSIHNDHTIEITFSFVAAVPIPTPLFVIGNLEPHGVGATVNFWGAQWWKHNSISNSVSDGLAAFKGNVSYADSYCGGTWTATLGSNATPVLVGNQPIAVLVTGSIERIGSTLTGDIQKILVVSQSDPIFGSRSGAAASGIVTEVACQ